MLKKFLKVSLVIGAAVIAFSMQAKAQTVTFNAIGSSAFWLEAGLGTQQFLAPCLWTENTNTAFATDTSVSPSAVDKGSAWVAWTKGSDGTCATAGSVYAYLNTDSVVGNRCLFNGTACKITYPNTSPTTATANAIYPSTGTCGSTSTPGECPLPAAVGNALITFGVANAGATDIRPEDAEFAITRALKSTSPAWNCGTQMGTSQYLNLGYTNGNTINSAVSTKTFNVVNFSLPSSYTVTTVGATPVLVAFHSDGTGTGFAAGNISNSTLAKLLDGSSATTPLGGVANVFVREPLSGTYNTMEYNIPNTTGNTLGITPASANKTSQDVGLNQPTAQQNCQTVGGVKVPINPLKFTASNGGVRQRAIGTGEELTEVGSYANPTGGTNNLGYGFWSVANFASLGAVTHTGYYEVDNIDPLNAASGCSYTGTIPTNGTTALKCVDLHTVYTGTYPIWSLLRLVTTTSGGTTAATNVAGAAQSFVSFGTTTSRPDFVTPDQMQVVRSHFIPPFGAGEPTTASNGVTGCTTEQGGDVGGVVFSNTGSSKCTTGQRR